YRDPYPADREGRRWNFPQRARGRNQTMTQWVRARHAVAVMTNGENAGVVSKTLLYQHGQSPHCLLYDRETGCPIPENSDAYQVFQQAFGPPYILPKLFSVQLSQHFMGIAMGGDLVTTGVNGLDYCRVPLSHPSKNKKRSADAGRRKNIEHLIGI